MATRLRKKRIKGNRLKILNKNNYMAFLTESIFIKCTIKKDSHQFIFPSVVVFTSHPKYHSTELSQAKQKVGDEPVYLSLVR